jgi:hypothetical protein
VTNTDQINISAPDTSTDETLTISEAQGTFAPGKTAEADGSDEIEQNDTFYGDPKTHAIISVDGYQGSDTLDLSGAAEGQTVYVGPNTPVSALWAQNIARVIGSPYRDRLSVYSGSGAVTFGGGRGNNRLVGGPGDNTLNGGADDRILGKGGTDTCPEGPVPTGSPGVRHDAPGSSAEASSA